MTAFHASVEIVIYSDIVCPWCYIGKRRLEQALEAYDGEVTIRYRPFQLDPRPVSEPRPVKDTLAEKFGGPARVQQILAHVTSAAKQSGLTLNFDRALTANTFDAHRLVHFATERGRASDTVNALFRAHFVDGVDIGSRAALAQLAATVGFDEQEVRAYLDSSAGAAEVSAEVEEARRIGVTSVPTFVFAGKYVVTGAQPAETLLKVMNEIRRHTAANK
ncbi:MAG: disulfide bond formation protein DsbA [Actinobacteria bacterium]|nr:MAG: disulfide bond formation protein DsbA [Actinomycetota bacterium]